MNLIRNPQQLALNDLLVAIRASADHYRDAAAFVESWTASEDLGRIAGERDALVQRLEEAVRSAGDLPSVPDEDRESVEKLFHRLHASLSRDEIHDIMRQRLDAERQLAGLVSAIRESESVGDYRGLIDDIQQHVQAVSKHVEHLLSEQFT